MSKEKLKFLKSDHILLRNPAIQNLMREALIGKITKSEFVEKYTEVPRGKRNRRTNRTVKTAMWNADMLEREFGWIWK